MLLEETKGESHLSWIRRLNFLALIFRWEGGTIQLLIKSGDVPCNLNSLLQDISCHSSGPDLFDRSSIYRLGQLIYFLLLSTSFEFHNIISFLLLVLQKSQQPLQNGLKTKLPPERRAARVEEFSLEVTTPLPTRQFSQTKQKVPSEKARACLTTASCPENLSTAGCGSQVSNLKRTRLWDYDKSGIL